jgi:hypothetical protein
MWRSLSARAGGDVPCIDYVYTTSVRQAAINLATLRLRLVPCPADGVPHMCGLGYLMGRPTDPCYPQDAIYTRYIRMACWVHLIVNAKRYSPLGTNKHINETVAVELVKAKYPPSSSLGQ